MKNRAIIILAICAAAALVSCHMGRRHTTIIETTNNNYLKIEYAGRVYFNHDETAIAYISPGGYLKYRFNDKKLEAENNRSGAINYELYNDGRKLSMDDNGRQFIAEAVKMIIKKGGHNLNPPQH